MAGRKAGGEAEGRGGASGREARAAEALRSNLRRRKAARADDERDDDDRGAADKRPRGGDRA